MMICASVSPLLKSIFVDAEFGMCRDMIPRASIKMRPMFWLVAYSLYGCYLIHSIHN